MLLMLKVIFVLEIFPFLFWLIGHIGKRHQRLGSKLLHLHILPNTSRSKGNQVTKFVQLIEHNVRNIPLQKLCRKRGRETIMRLFFSYKKVLYESKWSATCFNVLEDLNLDTQWKQIFNFSGCWSRDILNFQNLKKGIGLAFPPHFVYDFLKRCFSRLVDVTSWGIEQSLYCNYLLSNLWRHEFQK